MKLYRLIGVALAAAIIFTGRPLVGRSEQGAASAVGDDNIVRNRPVQLFPYFVGHCFAAFRKQGMLVVAGVYRTTPGFEGFLFCSNRDIRTQSRYF